MGGAASADAASDSMRFGRGTLATSGVGAHEGCQPKSGKRLPQPMIRNCWTTRYAVYTIQYRIRPLGKIPPQMMVSNGNV